MPISHSLPLATAESAIMLGPTGHEDHFTRKNLPPFDLWPDFFLESFKYPEWLNVGVELTDKMVERGFGNHVALIGQGRQKTYKELTDWTNRLARTLVEDYGVKPGNRVLLRSQNTPAMVACWIAVLKAGGVAINTLPMLRAGELCKIIDKAEVEFALCDSRLTEELHVVAKTSKFLKHVIDFDGSPSHEAELDRQALSKPVFFEAVKTGRDDVALLGFTSGSTGAPKATMHFHRDLLIIADAYAKQILQVRPNDIFIGSPPLAFTFGLGGLAIFPLRYGAASVLLETIPPRNMVQAIRSHRATICFTAPTAFKEMLAQPIKPDDLSSLRIAVSAGETLPGPVFDQWVEKTGKPILDGIGSTEMLHIFLSNSLDDMRPSCTGKALRGYDVRIVNDEMNEVPRGTTGHLAVRGPVGCRYLADTRQTEYVRNGWNITGDAFYQDEEGYFHFAARIDNMIVSAGYNIAGPEVESALLLHPAVSECAVIACPDEFRGHIVQAHVVLSEGFAPSDATVKILQEHVKQTIAPYKYPRSIVFAAELPKTETGKLQKYKIKPLIPRVEEAV